jgi:hypothetical protein
VATQLTRLNPLAAVERRMPLRLSQRALLSGFAFFVALGLASPVAGIYNAHRDEDAARARLADDQALIAQPPASVDALQEDLTAVRQSIATAEAAAPRSTPGPAADAATTLLVRNAQAADLAVKTIARVTPAVAKLGDSAYDTQGVRMTVDGQIGQIIAFLDGLRQSQPSLIASLTTMTIDDTGVTHADITFTTYTRVASPTPAPRGTATPKAKR